MQSSGVVLLVEDNRALVQTVGGYLESRSFDVDYAMDGLEGYRLASENRYDAIVLDGNLPRMDGLEVVKRLRETDRVGTPIIMVTARDTLEDKIAGLEQGVDDYLTKPFSAQELEARLKAVIRRNRKELCGQVLQVADLTLDPMSQQVRRGGKPIAIASVGMKLLQILMRESPRVVSRREIEREIWGDELPDSDVLRSHLYNLRRAIDRDFSPALLQTVKQAGYRLADLDASGQEEDDVSVDRAAASA
ncbi:response regulator transcription factor [Pseudoxanthomonas sp. LjRoot143]|uniref:response regulator transcription factor n=1 Tax=Pseudoxanthomonas sp. LjRoot143 TaxID=3342266 RepID=UPI003ED1685D